MATRAAATYLRRLQVLQGEVPELGGGVQEQELETSRGDVGRLSRLAAGAEEAREPLLLNLTHNLALLVRLDQR